MCCVVYSWDLRILCTWRKKTEEQCKVFFLPAHPRYSVVVREQVLMKRSENDRIKGREDIGIRIGLMNFEDNVCV